MGRVSKPTSISTKSFPDSTHSTCQLTFENKRVIPIVSSSLVEGIPQFWQIGIDMSRPSAFIPISSCNDIAPLDYLLLKSTNSTSKVTLRQKRTTVKRQTIDSS
jgi:hypothetical protein